MRSTQAASFAKKIFLFSSITFLILSILLASTGCSNSPGSGQSEATEVVIANMGAHSVMIFELTGNGTLPDIPTRVISGSATGIHNPFDVAIDGLNRIWVANLGDPAGSSPSITVYEPTVNGNAAPSFTFSLRRLGEVVAPGSLAKFSTEIMLAAGPAGPASFPATGTTNPDFTVLKPTVASMSNFFSSSFSSASAELVNPTGIAFRSDSLFVARSSLPMITGFYHLPSPPASSIFIFKQGPNGFNPVSVASIEGNNTGLQNPGHIDFDEEGNLYVLNRGIPGNSIMVPSITVYGHGQTGNIAPVRIIRGPKTGLVTPGNPYGLAVTKDGRVFVSTENRVLVFEPGATGNVEPFDILENTPASSSNNSDLSSPVGIAVKKK